MHKPKGKVAIAKRITRTKPRKYYDAREFWRATLLDGWLRKMADEQLTNLAEAWQDDTIFVLTFHRNGSTEAKVQKPAVTSRMSI